MAETPKQYLCDKCPVKLSTKMGEKHMNKLHFKSKQNASSQLDCLFCNKSFKRNGKANRYDFNNHLYFHINEKPHWCPLCAREFSKYTNMTAHLQVHTGEKPHKCPKSGCDSRFATKHSLQAHLYTRHRNRAIINDPNKFKCKFCPQILSSKRVLRAHVAHQHGEQCDYTCKICGRGFQNDFNFSRHQKEHKQGQFSCSVCGIEYKNKENLREHVELTHSEDKPTFKCHQCNRIFRHRGTLYMHTKRVHSTDKPYACHLCDFRTAYDESLKHHLVSHKRPEMERIFPCKICDKKFQTERDLKGHMKNHNDVNTHKCNLCPKSFKIASTLTRHIRLSHALGMVFCVFCKKQFQNTASMEYHLRMHIHEKPHPCSKCPKWFVSKTNLKIHLSTVHNSNRVLYSCPDCPVKFGKKGKLEHHKLRFHNPDKRPPGFTCIFCNKNFPANQHRYFVHLYTHTTEKPYFCPLCSVEFANLGNMKSHLRTHLGERTYKCTWKGCTKTFRTDANAKRHLKAVHYCNQPCRRFTCIFCNKLLPPNQHSLLHHMYTHTQEKPYFCPICSTGFAHPTNLKSHIRSHTGEKPYKCPWKGCHLQFKDERSFKWHLQVHKKRNTD